MNMREQFEEWECNAPEGPQTDPTWLMRCGVEPDKYGIVQVQRNWEVWNASRTAVEIELPAAFWPGYVEEDEPGLCISTDLFSKDQVIDLLFAIGLRVKE